MKSSILILTLLHLFSSTADFTTVPYIIDEFSNMFEGKPSIVLATASTD